MTIIGVDLGTRRVALACPPAGWYWRADLEKAAGRRDYPSEVDAGRELGARARTAFLCSGISIVGVDFYYERPLLGRPHGNSRTAIGQGLSAGAVLSQLPGTLCVIENSSTWKKELVGHGSADKGRCRAWLADHQPQIAEVVGEDEDLVDAACIALWAAMAEAG